MYRKMLLAYDGSVDGRLALGEGARLAQLCGAHVCLLAVVQISTGMVFAEGMHPGIVGDQSEVYRNILAEGERRLRDMGSDPKSASIWVTPDRRFAPSQGRSMPILLSSDTASMEPWQGGGQGRWPHISPTI